MHAHLAAVLAGLDEAYDALRDASEAVPADRRHVKPAPERWSAAEVLEHIALAEGNFFDWIRRGIDEARAQGLSPEESAFTPLPERIQTVMGDRVNRREAPEQVRPAGGKTEAELWQAIRQVEQALRVTLAGADGLALSSVSVAHPRLGPLNVYQWVELIAAHRRRHVAQLREIAGAVTAL